MTRNVRTINSLFIVLFLIAGCKKEDDIYVVGNKDGERLSNVLAFSAVTPIQIDADSASVCSVTVKIDAKAATGNRVVKFVTDGGKFANGDTTQTVTANSEGYANAYLLSDRSGKMHIRASVLDAYSIDTAVTFMPALPDDFLLTADVYRGDTSASFTITSTLFRNAQRGKISEPIKVIFSVIPVDTSISLVYPPFAFSGSGVAAITLTNPYNVTGRFNVTSKVLSSEGDSLSRTILIDIK
jgi:hypothetical protein